VLFALVDCVNFFASCERVFDPSLRHRPVVVLSNNDGCAIARSKEVKALGVPIGAPYHQWKEELDRIGAAVFSANFALYGDLSHRVMEVLRTFPADVEVYSIDEAFLALPDQPPEEAQALAELIEQRVYQWTGVPVRVGIARTKTLAKAAGEAAELIDKPAFVLTDRNVEAVLARIPIEKVWGIGWRTAPRLRQRRITTALDLRRLPLKEARTFFNVTGLRTVYELQGVSCIPLERAPSARRSITHSRSFGTPIAQRAVLREALASFVSRAAARARKYGLAAGALQVYATTGHHARGPRYSNACTVQVPAATNATPPLIGAAARALDRIWRDGVPFRKAGVILFDLTRTPQQDLFAPTCLLPDVHRTLDTINRTYGPDTLAFASTGLRPRYRRTPDGRKVRVDTRPEWLGRRSRCSPLFTTRWAEIPRVSAEDG